MNEFGIISKYFAPLTQSSSGAFGLKDDAAVISPESGYDLVITKDAIIENVHFLPSDSAFDIAVKLMAVNLSDLAAKGAKPVGYFLAIMFPKNTSEKWLEEFASGISNMIKLYGGAVLGGDTTSHNGALALSLTAIGQVKTGAMIKRSGAKTGDDIYVSGTIGDSFLGLNILQGKIKGESDYLVSRYKKPQPRVELGLNLVDIANSSIDVSDGLLADLGHICEASGLGAIINPDVITLSEDAEKFIDIKYSHLSGGDDYEILFTAKPEHEQKIQQISDKLQLKITKIGNITSSCGVKLINSQGEEVIIEKTGYSHF